MPANKGTALFWAFDLDEPSFRHRMRPLAKELESRGWRCTLARIPSRRAYITRILERSVELRAADVLIMHRIKLSPFEPLILRRCRTRVVYDIDDAVFLHRPRRVGQRPGRSWFRFHKFFNSCRSADLITVGNRWLGEVAARSGSRVEVVPTSVVPSELRGPEVRENSNALVWIGLPENLVYLDLVRQAMARLAKQRPDVLFRVVSSRFPDWPEVPIERVEWRPEIEKQAIRSAGVGIMPLTDDDWSRGKCAFKLLQYMAEGLPCVASPVGANNDVVVQGETGLLASSPNEWFAALDGLLADEDQSRAFGRAGLERVRNVYDRTLVMRHAADLVEEVGFGN